MPTIIQEDSSEDHAIEAKRVIIREALDDIANDVGIRLKEAGLNIPIFLSVPESGKAIVSLASPVDGDENDWCTVSKIVCEVAGKRLNGANLVGRTIRSAMATASLPISVADLIAN